MTDADWKLPRSDADRAEAHFGNVLLSFLVGLLLALTQFSYFFLLEVNLTSRAISFFVALFFWLIGFLIGLNLKSTVLFPRLITIGVLAYYPALLLTQFFPFNTYVLPFVGVCIAVSGVVPGYFFPYAKERFKHVGPLFFHENNGFLLGTLVCLLAAVFAGKWLLSFAPLVGIVPVLSLLAYEKVQAARPSRAPSAPDLSDARTTSSVSSVFPFYMTGLHFGILQASLFFIVQVYVTATFMGYFVVVLAWMAGVILSLKVPWLRTLENALLVSGGAYYVMILLASIFVPYRMLFPVYFLLAVLVALPAGTFFREYARSISARSLFLHENNGFVLGLLLSLFGFVKWGVNFLYLAPLLSFGMAYLARSTAKACLYVLLPATTLLMLQMNSLYTFGAMVAVTLIGLCAYFIRPAPTVSVGKTSTAAMRAFPSVRASRLLLALAGFNLILLQYFITREFSTILAATELTILIVGIAYFAGYSVGYGLSRRLPEGLMKAGAFAMFFVHLGILLLVKVLAGYLIQDGYGLWTLVGLLFLASFCASSLYSIFLPRLIEATGSLSLESGYTWDLSGAIVGTAVMFLLTALAPALLWPLYFLMMLAIVLMLFRRSPWWPGIALAGLLVIGALSYSLGEITTLATEDYYRTRDYAFPRVDFQGNSFYHSVEVLDTFRDAQQRELRTRTSFINGVPYFRYHYDEAQNFSGESSLSEFTYFLAELPAHYLYQKIGRKLRILIMGGGSMYSINRVSPYASYTTLVEIDPLILESAKASWSDINRLDQTENYEVVLDDVKHYLQTTNERFDLIINDISAPYYLGTTLLHGKDFYELVESRLKPKGLFAESTQGRPLDNRPESQAMKILRGVADVFPRYRVVDSRAAPRGRQGYVYASQAFPFATAELTALMKEDNMYDGTSTYTERSSHFRLYRTTPFSLTNMETLLDGNIGRLKRRLNLESDQKASFARLLRRMIDPSDPLHSRLFAAARKKLWTPMALSVGLLLLAAALGLRRWVIRRKRLSAI